MAEELTRAALDIKQKLEQHIANSASATWCAMGASDRSTIPSRPVRTFDIGEFPCKRRRKKRRTSSFPYGPSPEPPADVSYFLQRDLSYFLSTEQQRDQQLHPDASQRLECEQDREIAEATEIMSHSEQSSLLEEADTTEMHQAWDTESVSDEDPMDNVPEDVE